MEAPISVTIPIGAVGTANKPLFRVPAGHGGITILAAYLIPGGASTVVASLSNLGTALGTAISANIGTLGSALGTLTANVQRTLTISTAYQDAGTWIGWTAVTGITDGDAMVELEYKYGK
jgi:hypothetical protein